LVKSRQDPPVADPVAIPTAAQVVAARIRRRIIDGDLRTGDALAPESSLVEEFGVSRPTLREALRILQSESLIAIRRGGRHGARVLGPGLEPVARDAGQLLRYEGTTLGDVYRARQVIESAAAGMVAARGASAASRLRAALDAEAAAADLDATIAASTAFHRAVVELAGNQSLLVFAGILSEIIDAHAHELVDLPELSATDRARWQGRAHDAHRTLIELVERANAEGAERHWAAHLEASAEIRLRGQRARRVIDLME
jgi:DNA-binding FadR family transcriptional regulator